MAKEKHDTAPEHKDRKAAVQPDEETLHTTDPQEHMKGPVSSIMQNAKENFDTNETKSEADKRRDEHL